MTTTRPIDLADWQVRAALDGRLGAVVVPMKPQPPNSSKHVDITQCHLGPPGDRVRVRRDGTDTDILLHVADIKAVRLRDMTDEMAIAAGYHDSEAPPLWLAFGYPPAQQWAWFVEIKRVEVKP